MEEFISPLKYLNRRIEVKPINMAIGKKKREELVAKINAIKNILPDNVGKIVVDVFGERLECGSYSYAIEFISFLPLGVSFPVGHESMGAKYLMAALLANKEFNKKCKVKIYTLNYSN